MERSKPLKFAWNRGVSMLLLAFCLAAMWMKWIDFSQGGKMAANALNTVQYYLSGYTVLMQDELETVADAVEDGGISLAEGRQLLRSAVTMAELLEGSGLASMAGSELQEVLGSVKLVNGLYQLLFWGTIAASIWAAVRRLQGRDGVDAKLYAAFFAGDLVLVWVLCAQVRNGLSDLAQAEMLADLVRPTIWAVLAPVCAILSAVLWNEKAGDWLTEKLGADAAPKMEGLRQYTKAAAERGGAALVSCRRRAEDLVYEQRPWKCPACGAQVDAGQKFCPACGEKRPQISRCPRCGALQKPGAGFCSSCGNKFDGE